MFNFFNKTDAEIKTDVENEFLWDPRINSSHTKVNVNEGIVTISGSVPHYFEKKSAEHAAQRVGGVTAVVDELEVKGVFDKSDEDIAEVALSSLKWNYSVPEDIKLVVENGWITLDGDVDWDYQRQAAKDAVSTLLGVTGVSNNIKIRSKVEKSDIKTRIEDALKRSAESEGKKISVSVHGDKVTLSGNVHSYMESEDARFAAWMAPGVMSVENNLTISR